MRKLTHSERLTLVRLVVENLPEDSIDRGVALRYMANYTEMDIRAEMQITRKSLTESRKRLKQLLLAGEKREIYKK